MDKKIIEENEKKEKMKIYNRMYYRKYYEKNKAKILKQIKARKGKIKTVKIVFGSFTINF